MATRSNIIIEDDLGSKKILYHHFDGSPKGVGAELQMYLRHLPDDIDNPENLSDFICLQSNEYIPRNYSNDDIDYLYTINTSARTLHCKDVISGADDLLYRYSPIIGTKETPKRLLIQTKLSQLEEEYGIRILLAIEAGSRAWGFSSPDSDWDIRFIYIHRPQWYLTVEPGRDTLERSFEEEKLDLAGWDLRKGLSLFRQTKPSLLEWLHSPIIYRQDVRFVDALQALEPPSFNPIKAMHHYLSIARGHNEKYLQRGGFTLKRFLYYLRGLLACIWIEQRLCTPPVRFTALVEATVSDPAIREAIDKLLTLKRESKEHDQSAVAPELIDFTAGLMQYYQGLLPSFRPPLPQADITPKLDKLLFKYLIAFGKNYKI